MKNSYDMVQNLLNGGLIEMITNKKTKKSKRYTILICCILFYLLLIVNKNRTFVQKLKICI